MKNIIVLLFITVITACGYNSGTSTSEPIAYLYFTGEAQGAQVYIDDLTPFTINKTGFKNQYQVMPGKHLVVIKREGKVLVNRNVLLGDGHEKEFHVPK
ncbi:hypothetical protein [Moritella sp.]|uniref:hypothetical protein n=1 Tax=Moritella sp. TaxID=78556 RepID=UPI001D2E24F9|nr:hypothetical protein [Moritella sp.]MCJ8350830.1 hypothetical protein [Moritella sp.]NQZ40480.1 hypothetical protein [Moritella sp.]